VIDSIKLNDETFMREEPTSRRTPLADKFTQLVESQLYHSFFDFSLNSIGKDTPVVVIKHIAACITCTNAAINNNNNNNNNNNTKFI